jgi:uncharacterized protein
MRRFSYFSLIILACIVTISHAYAQPRFRVLALAEPGGHHIEYSMRARVWLDKLAADSNFKVDYIHDTESIDRNFLDNYSLFIQLDYPPYGWKGSAVQAFEAYIRQGKGGWIGFHHATLLGEFNGHPMWQWFHRFMGSIRWKDYIATFASATVKVERPSHPIMKNIPPSFFIQKEEWYTYDKSPRKNVQVIASVDENSYQPDSKIKMGDHPVIWSNTTVKARNVYIFMGHSPVLFDDRNYCELFKNAIFWAVNK